MTDEDPERAERTSFDKHLKRGATTVMNNLDRTKKHFKDVLKAHELKLKTVEVLKVMKEHTRGEEMREDIFRE